MSGEGASQTGFRVVVFTSSLPRDVELLIARIGREAPEARVCGVVLEERPPKTLRQRISNFSRKLRQTGFLRYAAGRLVRASTNAARTCADHLIDLVHAARRPKDLQEDLPALCARLGCALLVTLDIHAEETLGFVQALAADLGIVYGTRILKPELFSIPRHGSINVHKRKVPDYRGGGPVGLWELLDGRAEIGVTVHQVTERLDAGAIVNSAAIPIEAFDTLKSLALKAHVVGDQLLARSVADFARDQVELRPQEGTGQMFKSPSPQQLARFERQLRARRPVFRPLRTRPSSKLLARTLLGLPLAIARNWTWRLRGSYPITVLFHHVITDRPHPLGMPTEVFYDQLLYLKRHYRIVSLSEAMELLRTNRVTAPTVVLTFDDGYGDNYITLRAVAEQMGVPVTLFVSTAHITSQAGFDHDVALERIGFAPLSWEQLAQLAGAGFEIGSHTRTHFDCGSRSLALLKDEIIGSKQDLEARLGQRVEYFSFPFGLRDNVSPEALELAKSCYSHVFSAFGGRNFAAEGDGRYLKRAPHVANTWELELQLQALLEFGESASGPTVPAGAGARNALATRPTEAPAPELRTGSGMEALPGAVSTAGEAPAQSRAQP